MLTKTRIKELIGEFSPQNITALIRAEAGLPFNGEPYAIGRLRELELVEKGSWSCTEDGRQVVGELVGIPYKPVEMVAGVPADEPHRTSDERVKARYASWSPDGRHRRLAEEGSGNAITSRACLCVKCLVEIPKGAPVVWIADKGIFHPACASS